MSGEMTAEEAVPHSRADDAATAEAPQPLTRHTDFNKLWAGQAVSSVGSEVTKLALPLTAVLYLNASAAQVGLLTSAQLLAYAGPSLLFGVLADRVRRRPLMIGADIGRACVLGVVPPLAAAGLLSMPVMYLVALVHGALTVIFDVAYRSYLPSLVGSSELLAGNSRLQATDSVSQVSGPALSGGLVSLLGAPQALMVDAGSFVVSVLSLMWIRKPEPSPRPPPQAAATPAPGGAVRRVVAEVADGLRFIYHQPLLRAIAGSAATFNFFSQLQLTLFVLYAARQMDMAPGAIGLVLAWFGVGGAIGAVTVGRTRPRLGFGGVLIMGYALGAVAILFLPLVPGPPLISTICFSAVYAVAGYGIVTANITMTTLRQLATPASLQGRMHASFRFAIGALMPFSAAIAGGLGEWLGLRATLFITAAGMPLSVIWVALSTVRKVRTEDDIAGVGSGH
jgi:MFS family permease